MATQILMDLESGKLQVQVQNRELENIARNINMLGVIVFGAGTGYILKLMGKAPHQGEFAIG